MHTFAPAGSGRRIRRAFLAAALPAALAAVALPAAAHASVVDQAADGSLRFRGEGGEANIVSVTTPGGAVNVQDLAGIESRTPLCVELSSSRVSCAIGVPINEVLLGSGNDLIAVDAPNRVVVEGSFGNDTYDGGKGPDPNRVTFRGGDGFDIVSYSSTDRAVRVSPTSFDGRIGFDEDIIASDVERIRGSRFGDQLTSLHFNGELSGDRGDDMLTSNQAEGAITRFDMGRSADGADRVIPGVGFNLVNYSGRTQPVNVTVGFGGANDGEAGERDDIGSRGSMNVHGGTADDTLSTLGSAIANSSFGLTGNAGADTLEGGEAGEFMDGGPGADTFLANGGADFIVANDGVSDTVGCGSGTDTAQLDNRDGFSGCENRTVVGRLQLDPRTIMARAGTPAELTLRWRHPQSWRKLRSVALRLLDDGAPVGEVTIRTRTGRISADGGVQLVRRATRLSRKGKTVTARLALRLDASLAGLRLTAQVEATDRRGARQLATDAGTIRVAR